MSNPHASRRTLSHPIPVIAGRERKRPAWRPAARDRCRSRLVPEEDLRIHECGHFIGAHVHDHLPSALPQPASTAAAKTSEDPHEHPTR